MDIYGHELGHQDCQMSCVFVETYALYVGMLIL